MLLIRRFKSELLIQMDGLSASKGTGTRKGMHRIDSKIVQEYVE
jgi:hypothetical protein